MRWIHHPDLEVDREVPDETVEIWAASGWLPGTREHPEPIPEPVADEPEAAPVSDGPQRGRGKSPASDTPNTQED